MKKDTRIADSKIKVIAYASKAQVFTYFIGLLDGSLLNCRLKKFSRSCCVLLSTYQNSDTPQQPFTVKTSSLSATTVDSTRTDYVQSVLPFLHYRLRTACQPPSSYSGYEKPVNLFYPTPFTCWNDQHRRPRSNDRETPYRNCR